MAPIYGCVQTMIRFFRVVGYFGILVSGVLLLEPSPAPEVAPVVKHVIAVRIQAPITSFSGLLVIPGNFHEALV